MEPQSDSQLLQRSCLDAAQFPNNIVRQDTPKHHLDVYYKRLNDQSERLFCEDGKAAVDILEYSEILKSA
jgi:hypothetical protein